MTDQLPADIAEAIEAHREAAYAQGYFGDSDHEGNGPRVGEARATLDAVILKHLSGDEAVNTEQQALAGRMEAWLRGSFYKPGEMPSSSMQASIGGLVCQHMPMILAALRAVPATDLGRSALAEEGRGT